MSTTDYPPPPVIPDTPSEHLNVLLKENSKHIDGQFKLYIVHYVVGLFNGTTNLYRMLHKDKKKESYVKWVVSCVVALLITILTVYLAYHSVVAIVYGVYSIVYLVESFVMALIVFAGNLAHTLLFIGAVVFVLASGGVLLSGIAQFDKEKDKVKGKENTKEEDNEDKEDKEDNEAEAKKDQ